MKTHVKYFQISWRVYLEYIKCIGVFIFSLFMLFTLVSQVVYIGSSLWLAKWSSPGDHDQNTYLAVYAALGFGQGELKVDYTIEYFDFHKNLFNQGFLFIHPKFVLLYNQ